MGGGGRRTQETKTEMPAWQQPYVERMMQRAETQYGVPLEFYPGRTIAPFEPEQLLAQQLQTGRALLGSPLLPTAQKGVLETMRGKYLTPEANPFLPAYVQRAFEETLPQIDTTAIQAGRYGSPAWGAMKGKTMADIVTGIYGPAYEAERARQIQAYEMAPRLAAEDYADIARLAQAGAERQAMQQAIIDEAIRRFEFYQMEPWQRLSMLSPLVTGEMGGVTVTTGGGK